MLQDDGNRDAFEAGDGPRLLLLLLDAAQSRNAGKQFSQLELLQILQLHGPLLLLLLLLLDAAQARSAGRPAYCRCCILHVPWCRNQVQANSGPPQKLMPDNSASYIELSPLGSVTGAVACPHSWRQASP